MNIYIISLFPEMFSGLDTSMLLKAQKQKLVKIHLINLRDFGLGNRKTVDDTPYGGGAGMILKPEPIFAAVEHIKKTAKNAQVILMSPRGKKYSQNLAKKLSLTKNIIIICGHYEGVDERVDSITNYEISIGDYILTGGEIPAMAVVDSIARLIPGVLGDERSNQDESFSHGILEYPQYTRPDEFRSKKVPEVLKSGNHAQIAKWCKDQAIKKTKKTRSDIINF